MSSNGRLWPRLSDISLSFEMISQTPTAHLSDTGYRALMSLVAATAAGMVWTYTPPGDGSFPDSDKLWRLAGVAETEWRRVRKEVSDFFVIKNGRWYLKEEWIAIGQSARFALPHITREAILRREGKVCSYCGDDTGPFEFDHIYPVARGGTDDPSNLTLACVTCNRSKGALTLREWVDRG